MRWAIFAMTILILGGHVGRLALLRTTRLLVRIVAVSIGSFMVIPSLVLFFGSRMLSRFMHAGNA